MTRLRDLPPAVRRAVKAQQKPPLSEEERARRRIVAAQNRAETERHRRVFQAFCVGAGLPAPVAEFRFHDSRKWRFDWAWPDAMVALEIDGGVHTGGRHTRGAGFEEDMNKLSEAAALGWLIVRTQPRDLGSGVTLDRLRRALAVGTISTREDG